MKINILTIFPEFFDQPLQTSILGKAIGKQFIEVKVIDLRQFALDKHHTTDERPFGGGPGMVLKVDPIYLALESLGQVKAQPGVQRLLTSAKGRIFNQQTAQQLVKLKVITIVCGHYEGVDERVAEHLIDQELRIGDYVLTGGEPAALVMIDAVARLLPGVLGNERSPVNESHSAPGKLGFPQYTRPADFHGWSVPEVLLSGNHRQIEAWRAKQEKHQ